MAVQYTVDSTLDEPDASPGTGGCLTAGNKCTLRAAIQESNASTLVVDEIHFDAAFNGQLADTITLGSLLPPIANPVGINAGLCATQAGQSGPCAGIEASALSYGLSVEDTNTVEISGLAITGATTGIRVVNSSKSFVARNNWLGLKLDGTNGSGSNTGIWLDPDSNEATIGGVLAAQGNVFVNNSFEGLDIEGADSAKVLGNYFGVKADGVTQAANGKNIEITDTDAFSATNNEVGTTISGAAAPCDGGCNVISGGLTGIDLNGEPVGNEEPATGPTVIHGNYVGLSANGTTVVANGTFDILVGKAENALVGGVANGDANFIAGGGFGIYNENGEGFEAEGNIIGSGPTGADVTAPGTGVFVLNTSNTNQVAVNDNVIEMDGGVGVEVRFGGAEIGGNFIEGAELGIWTKAGPGPAGANQIEDNVIGESEANGILIEDDSNEVLGNSIYGSGAAGIRLENPAALLVTTENLIGSDAPTDENNIRESGGDAIEIIDFSGSTEDDSFNTVARNRGEENAGLFIDLLGNANDGILPPSFASAIQSSASGSGAEPGATVRVFRKETAELGEIESFLGEAVAGGSGNWKVTYSGKIPVGTIVAATQTSEAGATSELATAMTVADPGAVVDPGGGGCQGGIPAIVCGKREGMPLVPQTTIRKAPKKKSKSTTAKFKFSSSEKGSTFQCKLDKRPWRGCKSPKTYKGLKPGKHVFKVRAIDKAGHVDPTPARRKFEVLPQ
jgi:CSLREA domain-containing protein